jgi:hypothetical protein
MKLKKRSATKTLSFQSTTNPTKVSTATEVTISVVRARLPFSVTGLTGPLVGR